MRTKPFRQGWRWMTLLLVLWLAATPDASARPVEPRGDAAGCTIQQTPAMKPSDTGCAPGGVLENHAG